MLISLSSLVAIGFLYQPRFGHIWDPSCFAAANGTFFCVFMHSDHYSNYYTSGFLAASDDGARWRDVGKIAPSEPYKQWWKGFVLQIENDPPLFVMNHGVYEHHDNDALRILTSSNLTTWTERATSRPGATWYHAEGRWDHMYMAKDDASGGFIGYAVSSPLRSTQFAATWPAIQRSTDGIHWTAGAPLNVSWHGVSPQSIEEGGFERMEVPGSSGQSMFFLIGGGGPSRANMSVRRLPAARTPCLRPCAAHALL